MKESTKNFLGVIVFYVFIVLAVIAIDARMEQLNQQKSATEPTTHIAQNNNR